MRVVEPYKKSYSMLRVYRDDLERIIDIVRENCQDVTIRAGRYEVENLDQLTDQHLATLPSFKIDGHMHTEVNGQRQYGMLRVDLRGGWSDVYVSSEACTPLMGAATQIDQILAPRRPRWLERLTGIGAATAGAACLLLVSGWAGSQPWRLSLSHPTPDALFWFALSAGSFVLAIAWWLLVGHIRFKYPLIIYMTHSHEHTSFWRRQKDAVLLALISGFIGLVVGVISTLLLVALTRP